MASVALEVARALGASRKAIVIAVFAVAALALRWPHFGDPAYTIDEQFYLLVGDRMLHGALPYVDVWDRKPIGLFLIYAAIRLLGGGGLWQYQIVAALFAAATAFLIYRIARRVAPWPAALGSGLLYLLWIELAEGGGGQSPVFYNLFMAGAGLAVLQAGAAETDQWFARWSFAAMALAGLAIQVKYTACFESLSFGLILSFWTMRQLAPRNAALRILLLAGTALTPTIAALLFYVAVGHGAEFWFANFVSIFRRGSTMPEELASRTAMALLRLAPFVLCIAVGFLFLRRRDEAQVRRWQAVLAAWSAAALIGLFAIGTLYSHYILPVFVPLCAFIAPALARPLAGSVLALLMAYLPGAALHWPSLVRTQQHQIQIERLVALIPSAVDRQCLEIFDGPPILAYLTHSCALSRYVFPDHLSAAIEANGIGVDPASELRRLLSHRPLAITIGEQDVRPPNKATFTIMRAALARRYRLAGRARFDGRYIDVYVRR